VLQLLLRIHSNHKLLLTCRIDPQIVSSLLTPKLFVIAYPFQLLSKDQNLSLFELKHFFYHLFVYLLREKASPTLLRFLIQRKLQILVDGQLPTGTTIKYAIPFVRFLFFRLCFTYIFLLLRFPFSVVELIAGAGDGIELRNHDCAL